jgi:hypothetical protein
VQYFQAERERVPTPSKRRWAVLAVVSGARRRPELDRLLFPRSAKLSAEQRGVPDWSVVYAELRKKNVTKLLLWQEYRELNAKGYNFTCARLQYLGSLLVDSFSQLTLVSVSECLCSIRTLHWWSPVGRQQMAAGSIYFTGHHLRPELVVIHCHDFIDGVRRYLFASARIFSLMAFRFTD